MQFDDLIIWLRLRYRVRCGKGFARAQLKYVRTSQKGNLIFEGGLFLADGDEQRSHKIANLLVIIKLGRLGTWNVIHEEVTMSDELHHAIRGRELAQQRA